MVAEVLLAAREMNDTAATPAECGRVLVIDDDRPFGGFMLAALKQYGHDAEWAGSVADALNILYAKRFDLVIIDFRLPDGSGLHFLREATDTGLLAGSAAIILTGQTFDEPDDIRVFHKPFDLDSFLGQIGEMVSATKRRRQLGTRATAPQGGTANDRNGRRPATKVELVLYVSPASENCRRAKAVIENVLERFESSQVRFSILDVAANPEHAAADSVLFTPTLVKRVPGPRTWIIGNLEHDEVLMDLLDGSGVARRRDGRHY